MATFSKIDLGKRKNITIFNTGDWHIGSRAFNQAAAEKLIQMVIDEKAYMTIGGDGIEGKTIDSPHFDPATLIGDQMTIDAQIDAEAALLRPIADRILLKQMGNHDLYLSKNVNTVKLSCERIGRPEVYGDYQAWINVCGVTMHFWHGRPTMPRGAKDPIQREANQKAWLKNKLYGLAGSAHAHYMAHTHHCMVVEPIEQYALLDSGDDVRGVYFTEQPREIRGLSWMPPDARWYVNTGTLRRGGGFGYVDYSEVSGFTPPPIACTKTRIEDGRIVSIRKVML